MFIIVITPSTSKQYRHMYNFAGNFLYGRTDYNNNVRDRMAISLLTSTSKVLTLLMVTFTFIMIAPIYENLFNDGREMIIPVVLPFIDPDTKNGFYINSASQMFCLALGAVIVPGTEIMTCVLKNTISAMAAIVEDSLLELGKNLEIDEQFSDLRVYQFRNIVVQILDFDRFDSTCEINMPPVINVIYVMF